MDKIPITRTTPRKRNRPIENSSDSKKVQPTSLKERKEEAKQAFQDYQTNNGLTSKQKEQKLQDILALDNTDKDINFEYLMKHKTIQSKQHQHLLTTLDKRQIAQLTLTADMARQYKCDWKDKLSDILSQLTQIKSPKQTEIEKILEQDSKKYSKPLNNHVVIPNTQFYYYYWYYVLYIKRKEVSKQEDAIYTYCALIVEQLKKKTIDLRAHVLLVLLTVYINLAHNSEILKGDYWKFTGKVQDNVSKRSNCS